MPVWKRVSRSLRNLLKSSQKEGGRRPCVCTRLLQPWASHKRPSTSLPTNGPVLGGFDTHTYIHTHTSHTDTHIHSTHSRPTHTHIKSPWRQTGSWWNGTGSQVGGLTLLPEVSSWAEPHMESHTGRTWKKNFVLTLCYHVSSGQLS